MFFLGGPDIINLLKRRIMKKRIISAMLACAMICGAFWLTGCGTEEDKTDDTENNTSVQPVSDNENFNHVRR